MSKLDAYFLVEQALAPLFWGVCVTLAIYARMRQGSLTTTLLATFATLMFGASVLRIVIPDHGPGWAKDWPTLWRTESQRAIGFWEFWLRRIAIIPFCVALLALITATRKTKSQPPPAS